MLIHFSILALILIMSLMYEKRIRTEKVLAAVESDGGYIYKSPLFPWLAVFGLITFYAAVRTGINDSYTYVEIFNHIIEPSWDYIHQVLTGNQMDKGFHIISALFKMYISTDYHWWFFIFAGVCSISFIHFLRKYAVSFLDSLFFFFCSTLYYNYFSMMRQWLAIAIVLFGFTFLRKGKFIRFLLLCILAAQFHNSAYLFIIVFFLVRGEAWSKKQLLILAAFLIAIIIINPILDGLSSATTDWGYNYVVQKMKSNTGSSILRPIIVAIPVVLSFIFRDRIKDKAMNICVNISMINLLLNILAVFTSGLFVIRFSTYFSIYLVILFPYLLNVSLRDHPNKSIIKGGYYVLYFLYFLYQMYHANSWYYASDIIGAFP